MTKPTIQPIDDNPPYLGSNIEFGDDGLWHVSKYTQHGGFALRREAEAHVRELASVPDALVKALEEIAEGKGAFSRDPFQHAKNCIEDMKQIALDALAAHRKAA